MGASSGHLLVTRIRRKNLKNSRRQSRQVIEIEIERWFLCATNRCHPNCAEAGDVPGRSKLEYDGEKPPAK